MVDTNTRNIAIVAGIGILVAGAAYFALSRGSKKDPTPAKDQAEKKVTTQESESEEEEPMPEKKNLY